MNNRQHTILRIGLVVVALMCLVPPWEATWEASSPATNSRQVTSGYGLVFWPPDPPNMYWGIRLDIPRLSVQLVAAAALCGALLLAAGGRGKDSGA